MSDKKRSLLNVFVSLFLKIIILFVGLLCRRMVIKYLGNEINGLNSLFSSIIGVLALAELGVGSAITFCMYKPIVDNDDNKVSALYYLFKKIYNIICIVIFISSLFVLLFLPNLAKGYENANINIYYSFILMTISVLITYLFSAKTSLINAYKYNYISNSINSFGKIIQFVLQIIVIVLTKNFYYYLLCMVLSSFAQWMITNIFVRKKYSKIISNKQKLDTEIKQEVTKNVKAMFMHKLGSVLVNTVDSIIISAFIGVTMLGKYTNYTIIMTSMTGVISLFFTPLTSTIGHLCISNNKEKKINYFKFFHNINFIIGIIFFLGYYMVINDIINFCFGSGLILDDEVVIVITINYFIQYMRTATLTFRDATGTFYYDRWKPLLEGIVNIVLSIIFVNVFGVVGVIVSTIITNMFICHIIEPYVLFKHGFKLSVKKYYLINYFYIGVFTASLFLVRFCRINYENLVLDLLVNGFISVGISFAIILVTMLINKDMFLSLKKAFLKFVK